MWDSAGTDRWTIPPWTDNSGYTSPRHLLLNVSGTLLELHRSTVHIYDVSGTVDAGAPLDTAVYQHSVDEATVPDGTGEDVWAALADYAT